jgi:hypothetical protein
MNGCGAKAEEGYRKRSLIAGGIVAPMTYGGKTRVLAYENMRADVAAAAAAADVSRTCVTSSKHANGSSATILRYNADRRCCIVFPLWNYVRYKF